MREIARSYPITIHVDGEELKIHVKRLSLDEGTWFDHGFNRCARIQRKHRLWLDQQRRSLTVDGQTRMESDAEVLARLELESSADATEERYARERADATFMATFCAEAITQFVTVPEGQVQIDGNAVTTGAQFLDAYSNRDDVLKVALMEIHLQNTLTDQEKKVWASRSVSRPTSIASRQITPGGAQGSTAAPVSPKGSVLSEVATDHSTALSGATEASS